MISNKRCVFRWVQRVCVHVCMCACIVECHTEFDTWQAISIDKLTKENTALRSDVDIAQREVTHAEQSSGGVKALQAKIEFYQVLVSCVPR